MNNRRTLHDFTLPSWAIGPLRARLVERRTERDIGPIVEAFSAVAASLADFGEVVGKALAPAVAGIRI